LVALVAIRAAHQTPFFRGINGPRSLFDKVARYLSISCFLLPGTGIEDDMNHSLASKIWLPTTLELAQSSQRYLLARLFNGWRWYREGSATTGTGQKVALLAIIDVPAQSPYLKYLRQFADQLGTLSRMSSEQKLQLFLRFRYYAFRLRYFSRLKLSDRIAYVRGKLGSLGRKLAKTNSKQEVPPANAIEMYEDTDVDTLAKHRIRNICALNERAYRAYIPRRHQGRVVLIRSMLGYTGDLDKDYSPDPYIGWGKVISGAIETYVVPGDHNEMIREPHVRLLAEHLRTCLDDAQSQLNSAGTN
jgi:thioesterase domain-containing protein